GFMNTQTTASAGAVAAAVALTVVLPAVSALLLVRSHLREKSRVDGHRAALRRNATEAELMRLAQRNGGKLMALEAGMSLHIAEDAARATLDTMVAEGRAELEVTDGGHLVYAFPTLRQLADKRTARGILDD
ncbi:MAG TPA: hypothetical protein VK358_17320, partial [Longimicrobium sp.]|nr:hypothetical protein [Longimicrobium sp.]